MAGANYKFYRNVVTDYKADNTGKTDASEAINAAIQDGNRCGLECGNTFTLGAIVYFPVSRAGEFYYVPDLASRLSNSGRFLGRNI